MQIDDDGEPRDYRTRRQNLIPTPTMHANTPLAQSDLKTRSKPVNPHRIKAVVPTFNDWPGLRVTLDSLLNLTTPPAKIAVANDNLEPAWPNWLQEYPVDLVNYEGNFGPAYARNRGFGITGLPFPTKELGCANSASQNSKTETNKLITHNNEDGEIPCSHTNGHFAALTQNLEYDWFYFTDCGCTHDRNLFLRFEETRRECGDNCIAIGGPVTGFGGGLINRYMTDQGILNPPVARRSDGVHTAEAIISANALICGLPFLQLGGFDTGFSEAAAEDLDLGLRLRSLGTIAWSPRATVAHQFEEDETAFYLRFRRYGRGNRKLEIKHRLPSLRARAFIPAKSEYSRLAALAVEAMQTGHDEVGPRLGAPSECQTIEDAHRRLLIILAKYPKPGIAKTRLSACLGEEQAAKFYQAFLEDLTPRLAPTVGRLRFDVRWLYTPDTPEFETMIKGFYGSADIKRVSFVSYPKPGLADQQISQLNWARLSGYQQAVIIPTDTPFLLRSDIENAFDRLEKNDLVLGPAKDGGYYLLGVNGHWDPLHNVTMSTAHVAQDIIRNAKASGLSVDMLPSMLDIDTKDDLLEFIRLSHSNTIYCPRTISMLPHISALLATNCPSAPTHSLSCRQL